MANLLKRLFGSTEATVCVLMYHRIAEVRVDPWQLCVSPSNFEDHLKVLKSGYHVISVAELVEKYKSRRLEKNTVCITFDDGYADNFLEAKPLLEQYALPATFFIATAYTGSGKQFWWDELEDIMLASPSLPATLTFTLNSVDHFFENELVELRPEQRLANEKWIWPGTPPTARCSLYLQVWELLLPMPADEIEQAMQTIREWAQYHKIPDPGKVPMTTDQLGSMRRSNFHLAIHTNSHPALPCHPKEVQRKEIATCRKLLRANFEADLKVIAYPYGRHNDVTVEVVREEGLEAAFTTQGTMVSAKSDPYRLGRFQVVNCNGRQFKRQMIAWEKMN